MVDTLLQVAYLVGLAAGSGIRLVYRRRNRQNRIAERRGTGVDTLLMALPSLGMIVAPVSYLFTPWLDFADYPWSEPTKSAAGMVGTVLYAGALWLLWRSHADLGRNWSPTLEIREQHSLVTQGVYRHLRHPMYAAHWLWGIAQTLLLQNWIAGFGTLATLLPLYLYRVPKEEQMMLDSFGEEWEEYRRRVPALIPHR